jgi:glutamate carboxypeptidase
MEKNPKSVALYEKANAFAQEVGFSYEPGGTGGGSDGNFTAALGVTTLDGMGGVGHGAHSSDEYLFVNQLPVRTAILAELIRTLE